MIRILLIITSIFLSTSCTSTRDEVSETAKNYATAWFAGDEALMASLLHEKFIKRAILPLDNGQPPADQSQAWKNDEVYLHEQNKAILVAKTAKKKPTDHAKRVTEISVLSVTDQTATVKIKAIGWTDFLQMAKVGGKWQIINALWETK